MPDPSAADDQMPPDSPGIAAAPPSPTPPGQPTGAASGPQGSPMLTPQKQAGKENQGKVKVQIAIHALSLAMIDVGPATPEGSAILEAIQKLVKKFGKTEDSSKQLVPAEIQQIMQGPKPQGAPIKPPMAAGAPAAA